MATPAASAHDRQGSYDGDHDGYSSDYDGDRDRYDGQRDGYRERDDDSDHHDGNRERADDYSWDDDSFDPNRNKLADKDRTRNARWGKSREHDKAGHRGSEVSQRKRAMLAYLDRADAFLADLADRVGSSELDPPLKSTLLGMIAGRQDAVAELSREVQAASTPGDLRALRPTAHRDSRL